MKIVLRLKSWYFAKKPVFPSKHYRGVICTVQVTPRNGNNLEYIFEGWYLVFILESHSKRLLFCYWATLMLKQVESYQFYHVIKNILNLQDTCKYGISSNPRILEYQDFIFVLWIPALSTSPLCRFPACNELHKSLSVEQSVFHWTTDCDYRLVLISNVQINLRMLVEHLKIKSCASALKVHFHDIFGLWFFVKKIHQVFWFFLKFLKFQI